MIRSKKNYGSDGLQIYDQKITLILRPLKKLLNNTHLLMGWLSFQKSKNLQGKLLTLQNPVQILADLYHFLRLEQHSGVPPSEQIWSNDQKLLETAFAFYSELKTRFGKTDLSWQELSEILSTEKPPTKYKLGKKLKLWEGISAAHKGHQMSMELLQLPSILAKKAGYYDFRVNNTLDVKNS